MEKQYTWKRINPGEDYSDALAVRIPVFVEEQGFTPESEKEDTLDPVVHHLVLYDQERPIATGRVFPKESEPGVYAIGRIAVLAEHRGGTGGLLMEKLEALATDLGAKELYLLAQCRIQPFYEKHGYRAYGEITFDEYCPHVHMRKTI